MYSGKFYRFVLILFTVLSTSLASAEQVLPETAANCAKLLITHIGSQSQEESAFLPADQLKSFLHGREDAIVLLRIPLDQVMAPISHLLDFSFASEKIQLLSDLHLLVGPVMYIVARGPSMELGEFVSKLNSKHNSQVSFQLLDSRVTETAEIDFSFRPRRNRLNAHQEDPKTALKKEFDNFEIAPQVGFWALEANINEAIYFVSGKSFESIIKAPALTQIAKFTEINEKEGRPLAKILKVHQSLIKSDTPVAIRYQDYYILNSAASEALVELNGSHAPSMPPSSVVVDENLVKHLIQCLPGQCPLDPKFEEQIPHESAIETPAAVQPDQPVQPPQVQPVRAPTTPPPPTPAPVLSKPTEPADERFIFRKARPKLIDSAPPQVEPNKEAAQEFFPQVNETIKIESKSETANENSLKLIASKWFDTETLGQLDSLDKKMSKLEENQSAWSTELAKSERSRFKFRVVTHYRSEIKPLLELYDLATDELNLAQRAKNESSIEQLKLDIAKLESDLEPAYKGLIQILKQESEKTQEFVLEIAPEKGQASDGEDVTELLKMYMELVRIKGGKAEIIKQSSNEHGLRFVAIKIKGKGLVDLLRFEQGSHKIIKQNGNMTISRLLSVKLAGDFAAAAPKEDSPHVRIYRHTAKNIEIEEILAGPGLLKHLEPLAESQIIKTLGKLTQQ